jgi:hypothetical protein
MVLELVKSSILQEIRVIGRRMTVLAPVAARPCACCAIVLVNFNGTSDTLKCLESLKQPSRCDESSHAMPVWLCVSCL